MVNIIGAACTFPSGPTLSLASLAINNGVSLIYRHPFYEDYCGYPVEASFFPLAEPKFDVTRWQLMVNEVVQQMLGGLSNEIKGVSLRLWLILPNEGRMGIPLELEKAVSKTLQNFPLRYSEVRMLRGGHAEGGAAIYKIIQMQKQDPIECIDIILAVDSWLPTETLMWMESKRLLHRSYSHIDNNEQSNPYGYVPSEGAAALVLTKSDRFKSLGCIIGVGVSAEEYLRGSELQCIGKGLTQAAYQAISQIDTPNIMRVVTDINGELYRADEFGYTVQRLDTLLHDDYQRVSPAFASGDIGCASLVMHTAVTVWQLSMDNANRKSEQQTLILSSSDNHRRSALVLTKRN